MNAERRIQETEHRNQTLNTHWSQRLQQKETEIAELRQTVNELEALVQAMNHKLNGGAQ